MDIGPPATPDAAASPDLSRSLPSQTVFESVQTRFGAFVHLVRLIRLTRKCALSSRTLAVMPRPLNVLTRPLREVADKAAQFARTVAAEREEFESHYRDNRKRVVADAWEIAYTLESGDDQVGYEFACACLRANRTRTARAVLESLALNDDDKSKYVVAARRRLARLAWKEGDLDTAIKALRSVRGRVARAQYRTWIGVATVRNGLLLAENGDVESARAVLMGGLLASGFDHAIARAVAEVYLNAACKTAFETVCAAKPERSDEASGPIPIILSGFGWSGSGAVADFLKGNSGVADIFSGREAGLWTGKYGLDRLYAHFATRGFNRRLLLEFLTRHCFGHSFLGTSKGTKSVGGVWSWLSEPERWLLLEALATWLQSIQEWQTEPGHSLLESFQALSSRLLQLLTSEQTACVLLSNCLPSDSIVGIRMFDAPAVIVSWRDPGDAYASKMAAFPDNTLELDGWKQQLMTRINRYLAGKREVVSCARLWLDLSFEEFVQNEALRKELLILLNLDDQPMQSTFDPIVSARNIGIHRAVSTKNGSAWTDLGSAVAEARKEAQAISTSRLGTQHYLIKHDELSK